MSATAGETWRQVFADAAAGVKRQRINQTPSLSGAAASPVLTSDRLAQTDEFVRVTRLLNKGNQIEINAGSLAGVTKGSLYTWYIQTTFKTSMAPGPGSPMYNPFHPLPRRWSQVHSRPATAYRRANTPIT